MQNELEKQVNFLVYSTPEQDIKVNAVLKDESIWLTQKAMAKKKYSDWNVLFQVILITLKI